MRAKHNNISYFVIALALFLISQNVHSQLFLSKLKTTKTYYKNEKWQFRVGLGIKWLYDTPRWTRIELDGLAQYRLDKSWNLLGGLDNLYRFEESNEDFLEIRPWIGITLQTPIRNWLVFKQRFKGELRNFIYTEGNLDNETVWRPRYRALLDYNLKERSPKRKWTLSGGIEWYIAEDFASGESFPSSQEYIIQVQCKFANQSVVSIWYTLERFSKLGSGSQVRQDGNTISLIYSF